jgi:hypothetical protein
MCPRGLRSRSRRSTELNYLEFGGKKRSAAKSRVSAVFCYGEHSGSFDDSDDSAGEFRS